MSKIIIPKTIPKFADSQIKFIKQFNNTNNLESQTIKDLFLQVKSIIKSKIKTIPDEIMLSDKKYSLIKLGQSIYVSDMYEQIPSFIVSYLNSEYLLNMSYINMNNQGRLAFSANLSLVNLNLKLNDSNQWELV